MRHNAPGRVCAGHPAASDARIRAASDARIRAAGSAHCDQRPGRSRETHASTGGRGARHAHYCRRQSIGLAKVHPARDTTQGRLSQPG